MKQTPELSPDKLLERILRVAALLAVSENEDEPETSNTQPTLRVEQQVLPAEDDDAKNTAEYFEI